MKKNLLIVLLAAVSSVIYAQNAPNLIGTDLHGNTHNIYDYLDQGKSVLLDFFILNCTPCQEASKYTEQLYEGYGPNGSNQLQIISVEVYNNSDEIVEDTANEWGISNPVINLDAIPIAYLPFVSVYPNYIMICPDKSMNIIHGFEYPTSLINWEQSINNCNFEGDFSDVSIFEPEVTFCDGNLYANLNIGNVGTNSIENLNIQVYIDSNYYSTISWDNILEPNQTTLNSSNPIIYESSNINGSMISFQINSNEDVNLVNNTSNFDLTNQIITSNSEIIIEIQTDYYQEDLSWNLMDGNGNIIYQDSGTNYEPNELINKLLYLDTSMCYTFKMIDTHGDGICCSFGEGYYQITAGEDTLVYNNIFLSQKLHSFYIQGTFNQQNVGIENTLSKKNKVIKRKLFNLNGQEINLPSETGVYIQKNYYENGSVQNNKILIH